MKSKIQTKLLGMLALFAAAFLLSNPANAQVKNIVLVHGAWGDGSGWEGVYKILTAKGYHVDVVSNSDLSLAKITSSTILVFGFNFSPQQEKILRENNIFFFSSKIIYEIEEKLEQIITDNQEKRKVEKECGVAKITKVFDFSGGNIAGCLVTSGKISRNCRVHVLQGKQNSKIFTGEIKSLESKNESKLEVISGQECGVTLKGFDKFQVGDKIIAFQIVEEVISSKR